MASPVFPQAYQVECRGILFGQLVENVWHCQGPDPFDGGVAADIAAAFQTNYAFIMNAISQDYALREIFVHNLAGTASGEYTLTISPPDAGGLVEDSMPGNVAFCISLRTALSGRRTRGRKYFSGLGVGQVTENTLSPTSIADLIAGVTSLRDALETLGAPMCIFSPTGLTLVPVISVTAVDNYVDSQRRRLTGRGR